MGSYQLAYHFLSHLTFEERQKLQFDIMQILTRYNQEKKTPHPFNSTIKKIIKYKPLIQYRNNHNVELVIREVSEFSLLKKQKRIEIFLDFEEVPISFLIHSLQIILNDPFLYHQDFCQNF